MKIFYFLCFQVAKGQGNPKELSGLCEDLYENYSTLVDETKFAIVLANKEVKDIFRCSQFIAFLYLCMKAGTGESFVFIYLMRKYF